MAIFIPEIFADAVNEKLGTTLRFGSVAFDATSLVPEIKSAGDTMHFPKLKRTATVEEVVKGTALTPSVIDMTDSEAVIKYIGSAFRVYDSERAQIKGVVFDKIIEQVSTAMSKTIDTDLAAAIDTDAVFKSAVAGADKITSAELQTAIDNFGDNVDTDSFAAIVVNSKLRSSFVGMQEFTNTALTYQTNGNGIVQNGVIGYYFGIPVIVTNNGTYDSAKAEAKTYIVKKDKEGIYKRFEYIRKLLAIQSVTFNEDMFDSLDFTFTVNRPVDTNSLMNELKTQYDMGAISKQTVIDKSPYTVDTSLELQRIEQENCVEPEPTLEV